MISPPRELGRAPPRLRLGWAYRAVHPIRRLTCWIGVQLAAAAAYDMEAGAGRRFWLMQSQSVTQSVPIRTKPYLGICAPESGLVRLGSLCNISLLLVRSLPIRLELGSLLTPLPFFSRGDVF